MVRWARDPEVNGGGHRKRRRRRVGRGKRSGMADQEALEVLVKTLDSQTRSFRVEPEVRRGLPEREGGGGGR